MIKRNIEFHYCKNCAELYGFYSLTYVDGKNHDYKCDFCLIGGAELAAINSAEIMDTFLKYRKALKLIDAWGEWSGEAPLPQGWPRKEDGKMPKSPSDVVKEALR